MKIGMKPNLFIANGGSEKMTQRELILKYLHDFGSITPMEAFGDLGITKLATRISEMRRDGMKFDMKMINSTNRYGKPCRFAMYSLPKKEIKQ